MAPRIGVFPASGGLGTSIVNHLMKLVSASQLVLITRNLDKWTNLGQAGATLRTADYDQPSTLDNAFDGVDVLMLISYASFEIKHRVDAHQPAIQAAIGSGVKHIFYSSLGFAGDLTDHSVAHVMGAHLETERYLAELTDKITYTSVREGLYTESFPIYTAWLDPANPPGEITIPHSGSGPGVAWVKRDELGEATAKLIVAYINHPDSFKYLNKKVLLTGRREISLAETVGILGRAIGKPLEIKEISVDEYVGLPQIGDKHTYHGVNLSREWATAWEAIKQGETAVVSPAMKEILGREPESYETTIQALIG
ncbi:Putative NmrA-like family protein [Penicillium brasilianum]|uniref:Putative NmrA-like family protein n=1 Tax=Penicillium brasilianum TaxID=104259 RepID=A0A0F7TY09_PENBI|nr:Putative NmrA-like family protein [Penicillium brasilianum]